MHWVPGRRVHGVCRGGSILLFLSLLFADVSNAQEGKLLLNMLIKNEAVHLDRSLPKWAPLIDYWIVGLDDHNTDNSEEIIQKHLGHIPGEIMVVEFDGMGPTWTKLVERGIEAFPNATHGLISDADFTPITTRLDKNQLRMDCSKHMYRIRSHEGGTVRNMDWIYRNLPGAKVERRTHQSVTAPPIPGQKVFQTLIDLEVQEYTGGYQDRSGNKSARYMMWLHKDLEERPNDPRTVYYIGHAHLEQAGPNPAQDIRNGHGPGHYHLNEALKYFRWRADLRHGYYEERWFAMLKAGEICERYMADYECSIGMWTRATELDPERADGWFYIGQHWRLARVYDNAIPFLTKAVKLEKPPRSMFQWEYLYDCLRHIEMGRAMHYHPSPPGKSWKVAKKSLQRALYACPERDEVQGMLERAEREAAAFKAKKQEEKGKAKAKPAEKVLPEDPDDEQLEEEVKPKSVEKKDTGKSKGESDVASTLAAFGEWYTRRKDTLKEIQKAHSDVSAKALYPAIAKVFALTIAPTPDCKQYLEAVQPYLDLFNPSIPAIQASIKPEHSAFWTEWLVSTVKLWTPCRDKGTQ
mmetsp:Transcript_45406/g.106647  ORF Transcript_45406/g.106647 Transcript_45406/m.106647 type:complete len:580 (-) Transcript_45406:109-1848(-)